MEKKRVLKAAVLIAIWAYAGATWASIGHNIIGLPDLTPIIAAGCALGAVAWTSRHTQSGSREFTAVNSTAGQRLAD